MITFGKHIELFKRFNQLNDIEEYLQTLGLAERVKMTRLIDETYPIKQSRDVSKYIIDTFTCTLSVESAVLGQFIMLEQIVTGKTKFKDENERDLTFAKLILRPKHHKEFDNEDIEEEKRNEEMILASPVQDVYNAINIYLDNRDFVLFKQFSGVFYEVPDDDEEEEEEILNEKTSEQLFSQQWYWYSIVRKLANEDITKYNEIYMLDMATVLPEMSYLAQRDKIEGAENRRQQAMSKL